MPPFAEITQFIMHAAVLYFANRTGYMYDKEPEGFQKFYLSSFSDG